MIQINPLKSYIDGGVRAAITSPPSASLVFDLPGRAIWVKGVKLKGTDHTYTFNHDNYINLTNTPGPNNSESEEIKIGININTLKAAIDTTYGVVTSTSDGLTPKFSNGNKSTASAATTYHFLGWTGTTLKWYQAPWRNIRINSETTDCLGVNSTDPLIISAGNGINVTWDSTNKKIVITNSAPDVNHNTDNKVAQAVTTLNKDYPVILKSNDTDNGIIAGVNFSTYLKFNPSSKQLKINGNRVITIADTFTGATASADGTIGLVTKPLIANRNLFLRGDGTWATPINTNTWRPIKVGGSEKLGSGTDTGSIDFVAGNGITLAWDATNKRITITNSKPHVADDTNTWRPIYLGGTIKLESGIGTAGMNLKAGSGVTITYAAPGTGSGLSGSANYGTYTINASNQIPSDNITGSGATNWIAKWSGEHTISKLVAISSTVTSQTQSTKFLREDGTWATPSYTTNSNTWRPVKVEGTEKLSSAINTGALDLSAGNGISIVYNNDTKKVIITNTKPDINHNTHYTTMMYIGENNDTKENKQVGNPYLKLFDDNARRATFQIKGGTGITVGSDTNGNITITNSAPDVNHNTDEKVKLTPQTNNVDRPLMMINGGTSTGEQINTSIFNTGIYANASTKMITANGFIKTGSSNSYVLLGGGNHKAISDFATADHNHNYISNISWDTTNKQLSYKINTIPLSNITISWATESGQAHDLSRINMNDLLNMTGTEWDGFAFNYYSGKYSSDGKLAKLSIRIYDGAYNEIARFNKSGYFGLGTSSPSYKLHVAGDIYTTTGFKKNGSSDSYVLLGGGGHALLSNLNVNTATSIGSGALKYMCSLHATNSYNAYKIITNWHKSLNIMPTINIRGYDYGHVLTIDCDIVMYHYDNTSCNYSLTNKGSYPIRVWQAIENDVLVFYINPGTYFGMFNVFVYSGMGTESLSGWSMITSSEVSGIEITKNPIATSITGNAATATNADTVDGYHFSDLENRYVNVTGDTMTGDLTITGINFLDIDGSKPVLKIGSPNKDTTICRVYSNDNSYSLNSSIYGYSLKYLGTGSGNDNKLVLIADNLTGTRVTAISITQDGVVTLNKIPTVNGTAISLNGHTHSYLPLSGGTVTGPIEIKSSINNNYNEGLRITRAANNWAGITFGSTGLSGAPTNGWFAATNPNNQFIISPDSSVNTVGLTLNKNGNALWRDNVILHAGNYSSYCASASHTHPYLPLSGGTMSGQILCTFGLNSWGLPYTGALQIRERDNVVDRQSSWDYAPAISFHWGNRYARRLGMRSDGNIAWDDSIILRADNFNSYAPKLDGTGASGTWGINISGNAATATNADTVDGYHASAFALSSHTHSYLPLSGGTMTGSPYIYFPASVNNTNLTDNTPTGLTYGRLQSYGTMTICGDTDGSTSEYVNITAGYSIANATAANGLSIGYNTLKWKGNTIWHTGNDGHGSGLDADLLDGYHASSFSLSTHTHTFNLGNTTITTNGGSYSGITGPFNIYTNANAANAFSIWRSSASEGVQHWVDDGQYHIDYTNDETSSSIHIRIINTDTESSNKTNTTDYHYYLDCYGNFHPGSNNTGSIGTAYYKWANMYATTFHGSLDGNASTATSATSATQATNLTPENIAHYFRDSGNSTWRGGMYWGSAGSESMSFVVANSGTRFQFVGGSDIANWGSSTWQSAVPYMEISTSGTLLQNNNSWLTPARLQLMRSNTTAYTDRACIGVTDGNLHIDSYPSHDIYLNYYSGNATVHIGNYIAIHSGNISSQSVNYASSAGNADTVDGQHFNWNNDKNDHTYLWAASSSGQAYLVHRASMSVNYASSAGNADTLDNYHASSFALQGAHNNLLASGDEFTFASSGFSGCIYLNYRTAGGLNGNITEYKFGNGKGGALGTALHTGNYTSYCALASHTHSVKINGSIKTIAATSGTAVDLGTYLTTHLTIYGLTIQANGTSLGTYIPNSASKTINITYSNVGAAAASHTHSYLPLAGGTMNADARISFNTNGNLYIGTADNSGYVYFQDIASQDGPGYWCISQDGEASFNVSVTAPTFYGDLEGNTAILSGKLTSSVSSGTYLAANKGTAIINSTAAAGFNMLARMKSTNGVFIHGVYNDAYCFYYTTDSVINAGTNTSSKQYFRLKENGYIYSNDILPLGTNNIGSYGTRWSRGYFTNNIHVGPNNTDATAGGANAGLYGSGCIELSHPTPYIDFHYAQSAADYTSRIIATAADCLAITSHLYVGGAGATSYTLRVDGSAYTKNHDCQGQFAVLDGSSNVAARITQAGDMVVSGGITMYSDVRKKDIISDKLLSVRSIADAPLFTFNYKSDEAKRLHTGTSAQYWHGAYGDIFGYKDDEGYYTLEYQNLGVAMGISLAREIVKYESKTDKEIMFMREKINNLEARIKELEGLMKK